MQFIYDASGYPYGLLRTFTRHSDSSLLKKKKKMQPASTNLKIWTSTLFVQIYYSKVKLNVL